jgi:hypothetical protein
VVDGGPRHCPEGIYYLRYAIDGVRQRDNVGADPDAATAAFQRKTAEINALALGISIAPAEPTTPKPEPKIPGRSIATAIAEYLLETENGKSKKTLAAYKTTLALFQASCSKGNLEDIDRKDMLAFIKSLRDAGNAPRTVRNRVPGFLRRRCRRSPYCQPGCSTIRRGLGLSCQ